MKAGTLEIELLTNVARLQSEMEQVKRSVAGMEGDVARRSREANANLRNLGKGAGASFSREVATLKATLEPAWAAMQRYKQEITLLRKALAEGAIGHTQYIQQVRAAKATYQGVSDVVVRATGAQRQGLQQLGFQIGDMATMYSLGAKPAQIFGSQIGQITQAIMLMSGGTSRLAGFLMGPWGIALTTATILLAPFVGKLFEGAKAAEEVKLGADALGQAQGVMGDIFDLTTGKIKSQTDALILHARAMAANLRAEAETKHATAGGTFVSAQQPSRTLRIFDLLGAAGVGPNMSRPMRSARANASALQGLLTDLGAKRITRDEAFKRSSRMDFTGVGVSRTQFQQALVDSADAQSFRATADQIDQSLDSGQLAAGLRRDGRTPRPKTDSHAETLLREAEATEALIKGLGELADAYLVSDEAALRADVTAKATEQGIKKQADVAEYVARQIRLTVAQRTADAAKDVAALKAQTQAQALLNQRVSEGGLTFEAAEQMMRDEAQLRPYLVAQALAEGDAKDKLAKVIAALRDQQARSNAEIARTQALRDAEQYEKQVVEPLRREAQAMGLVGWVRDKYLLQLEREAEIKPLLARQTEALAKGEDELAAALGRQIALINERYGLDIQMGDRADQERQELERLEAYNERLQQTIQLMQQLGGVGSALGGLLGFASGKIGSIGGPIGDLLNIQTGTKPEVDAAGKETGRIIARSLGDELRQIFKLDGEFGKTMQAILQGAGTGMMAGNAIFGKQSTAGQLGSAVGGALGEKLGEKFLAKGFESIAKGLGAAAGPIGSILGGLLGGALGGLIAGVPKGSATIGGVGGALGITGTTGSAYVAASRKSAGAIIDSLQQLADQLGATVDASRGRVSIGMRNGSYRVDPYGNGQTSTRDPGVVDFGEDAEAAAYYAMLDLIKDGVLVGLRAGTDQLLRNSKDLESGLAKALAFEGVFKELAAMRDPLAAAMADLDKQFDKLKKIFAEAGASASDYADLEELFARKRQEVRDQEARRQVEELADRNGMEVELLELLGRHEDSVAAARLAELAGIKAALQPMQVMIYQLRDARETIEKFGPLADGLRAFKEQVLGKGAGGTSFAAIAGQFRATAALARGGDADALGKLPTAAQAFLEAARDNAASMLDYQRAVGEVLGAVDAGIFAADTQVDYAQLQIDAINNSADIIRSMKDEMATYQARIATSNEFMAKLWQRFEGDGLRVKTDSDTPLQVEVV